TQPLNYFQNTASQRYGTY
nr:protocatechuate 3,4-dioxygenase type I alpha subunit, P34OI alpha {N-terminal} {EC 1.13.11.3} [Agrobacterium radiobacter, S2, DSM 5681, Peptide Partial, 18 aa] [Agrobacterium radiobacter]